MMSRRNPNITISSSGATCTQLQGLRNHTTPNASRNEEYSEFACRRRCKIAAFKRHGYFPSTEYTTNPLPIKHMNTEAVLNKTLLQDTTDTN